MRKWICLLSLLLVATSAHSSDLLCHFKEAVNIDTSGDTIFIQKQTTRGAWMIVAMDGSSTTGYRTTYVFSHAASGDTDWERGWNDKEKIPATSGNTPFMPLQKAIEEAYQ